MSYSEKQIRDGLPYKSIYEELEEKNKQLEQENERLNKSFDLLEYSEQKLKQENERLTKEIEEIKDRNQTVIDYLYDYDGLETAPDLKKLIDYCVAILRGEELTPLQQYYKKRKVSHEEKSS